MIQYRVAISHWNLLFFLTTWEVLNLELPVVFSGPPSAINALHPLTLSFIAVSINMLLPGPPGSIQDLLDAATSSFMISGETHPLQGKLYYFRLFVKTQDLLTFIAGAIRPFMEVSRCKLPMKVCPTFLARWVAGFCPLT